MADLKLTIENSTPDITILNGKPEMADGISNAVFLSLFTGPYWGNAISDVNERYTSTLPDIMSGQLTTETRNNAIEAARSSLAWMTDIGIADEIEVEAEIKPGGRLNLRVKIVKPDETVNFAYSLNWDAQEVTLL